MVILTGLVGVWNFNISATSIAEFLFCLRLKISGASVLYGFSESFLAIDFSFTVYCCILCSFLKFLCVFGFCYKYIAKASQTVNILIYGQVFVYGVNAT